MRDPVIFHFSFNVLFLYLMKVDRIMTKKKKFIYYSIYAWGFPFIISMITLTIESIPTWYTENLITPGKGYVHCI